MYAQKLCRPFPRLMYLGPLRKPGKVFPNKSHSITDLRSLPEVTNLLREARLTPRSMLNFSIMDVVYTLGNVCFPEPECSFGQRAYHSSDGDYVENYYLEKSSNAISRLKQITSNAGLCLDCVLSSDDDDMSTNCRIQHQERIPDGYDSLIG